MMISMYPIQPLIIACEEISFGSVQQVFPEDTFGAASPFLCFFYTLIFALPKYLICDMMLLTAFLGTDLECE